MGPMGPAGFRRRGRRRGLVVGAAIGASAARSRGGSQDQAAEPLEAPAAAAPSTKDQLVQLEDLKTSGLVTEAEYEAKKKQILGI